MEITRYLFWHAMQCVARLRSYFTHSSILQEKRNRTEYEKFGYPRIEQEEANIMRTVSAL